MEDFSLTYAGPICFSKDRKVLLNNISLEGIITDGVLHSDFEEKKTIFGRLTLVIEDLYEPPTASGKMVK